VPEGTVVTLTANVDPTAAPGSVTFFDGHNVLGTVSLGHGSATYETAQLTHKMHRLSARYVPSNTDWQPSGSPVVKYRVTKGPNGHAKNVAASIPAPTYVIVSGLLLIGFARLTRRIVRARRGQ
jgi:hypothetical protein